MVSEQRTKMNVEVRILTAQVIQQDPSEKDIYIEWFRGSQSIKTKKRQVDGQTTKITFGKSEARFAISASFYQSGESWREDINKLSLICADEVVGICEFDLASYIGKTPVYQKAMIVPQGHSVSSPEERVLKGNPAKYPDAFIEFRVTVKPKDSTPVASTPGGQATAFHIPSSTKNRLAGQDSAASMAAASSSQVDPRQKIDSFQPGEEVDEVEQEIRERVEAALEQLRLEKQPKLDMQTRCIAKYRQTREDLEQRKAQLEQLLNQTVCVNKGEEKQYISSQRNRIAELFEQLKREKERRNELHDKVQAYNEIKQRLAAGPGTQEEKLQALLVELKAKKAQMQAEFDQSTAVKLHKKAYEIDFDAY